jgi:glyoxylase-like metal-dependent hydrolase (beta-lactamase superfamily II)
MPQLIEAVLPARESGNGKRPPHFRMCKSSGALVFTLLALAAGAGAQSERPSSCQACPEWNETQPAFKVYGNTYYVGTHGLGSVLLTSSAGHILIDGALSESVPKVLANIDALGFHVEDVKLIVNSHVHFDLAAHLVGGPPARLEPIADVPDRLNVGRTMRARFYLRAQCRHAPVDAARRDENGMAPHGVQDHVA